MTEHIQNTSGMNTIDNVSLWDLLLNSQLLALLCNLLRYFSKSS